MTEELNPLRTFELDAEEWADTVAAVKKEGREEWAAYAPTVVAAIELGYLDEHLQMLGLFLKQRYLHLKDGGLAPAYAPNAGAKVSTDIEDYAPHIFPPDGIQPSYKLNNPDAPVSTGMFRARGYAFAKADFVGKHFASPVPVKGGAIYRIESVGRRYFETVVVAVQDPRVKGQIGREPKFDIDKQFRLYNIPR